MASGRNLKLSNYSRFARGAPKPVVDRTLPSPVARAATHQADAGTLSSKKMNPSNPVALALYRAMWRSTRSPAVKHARFRLPLSSLPDELAEYARRHKPNRNQAGLQRLVRAAWREGAAETDAAAIRKREDDAFKALRALGELQGDLEETINERISNADRTGIDFCIGEVLRHKKFGFRAVIIGWDRRPEQDVSHWDGIVGLPSGADQPFYRCLPDLTDCVENLGGPRDVRYVAQENLERLPLSHRRIAHPRLSPSLFTRFDALRGRWIPSDDLAFRFPGSRLEPLSSSGGGEGDGSDSLYPPALLASASTVAASVRDVSSGLTAFVAASAAREAATRIAATEAIEQEALLAAAAASEAGDNAGGGEGGEGVVALHPTEPESEIARSASLRLGPGRDMLRDLRMLLRKCETALAPLAPLVPGETEPAAGAARMAAEIAAVSGDGDMAAAEALPPLEDEEEDDDDDEYGYYEDDDDDEEEEEEDVAMLLRGSELRRTPPGSSDSEVLLGGTYRALHSLLKVSDYIHTNLRERASKESREGIDFHIGQVRRAVQTRGKGIEGMWLQAPLPVRLIGHS